MMHYSLASVWRFHRYYIRELIVNLALTFVMLFGISVLALVVRGIYESKGVDVAIGLWITLLWSIDTVPHLLAVSALVASVFTFGRAAADNEITAMRMSGTSPLRLLLGVVFVGALASATNAWLLHNAIPHVHYNKYRPTGDLIKQFLLTGDTRKNKREFSQLSMAWERSEDGVYYDVDFSVRAREGRFVGAADEMTIEVDGAGELLSLVARGFRGEHELMGENGAPGAAARRRVFAVGELGLTLDLRELLEKRRRQEGLKDLSTTQLVSEIHGGGERRAHARWYAWLRTSQGLAALLFAVLGFPIGLVFQRAGRMVAFAISFVPIGGYFALVYSARAVARWSGAVWPVWIPDAALAIAALVLTRKAFRA